MNDKLLAVREQKEKAAKKILEADPEKALFEYAKELLTGMNIDCTNIDSVDKLKEVVGNLPKNQQKEFFKEIEKIKDMQANALSNLKNGKSHALKEFTKAVAKGVATGASIAGVVNTIAPGIVPTFCGYLAGKGLGNVLVEIGILSIGFLGSQSFNAAAVLGASAVVGGVVGGACGIAKGIKNLHDKRKETNAMER